MKKVSVILFIIFSQLKSFGQTPDIPPMQADRPGKTNTPTLTAKGYVQIESGVTGESMNDFFYLTTPSILWKYGATKKLEIRLLTAMRWNEKAAGDYNFGMPPVEVGIKSSLIDEKGAVPQVSFIGHLAINDLSTTKYKAKYLAPKFRFAFQHSISKKFALGYNVGMEWNGNAPEPDMIYALRGWYSVTNRFYCFAELYGNKNTYSTAEHKADAGLIMLSESGNSMFDLSGGLNILPGAVVPAGSSGIGTYYFASLGYSFRFNTIKKVETIFVR